ncbi:hypothetical protein ACGTN6_16865 [Halomonas sp. THAF12]|uniref:hypothetical protein n=1 Tax=Halomonas sp. B23F22_10 TaxID=3459515 RepID=UPI00373F5F85
MQWLVSIFVGCPLAILAVALAFLAGYLALRGHPRPLLVAAGAWGLYAKDPEANIRVDLMLLWPILALLTLWALYRALLARRY